MKKFLLLLLVGFSLSLYAQKESTKFRPIDPIRPIDIDPIDGPNPIDPPHGPIIDPIVAPDGEVGLSEGQLSVSLSGAATYNIPIAVPPGLVGVAPQLSLSYSSQGGNGNAGYGWNVAGISSISRIPSTMFHDGVIDGVDFDNLDRFALDGQRLIYKSFTNNYETESFSNIKITSYTDSNGMFTPRFFIVNYPDGSEARYNATATRFNYLIDYWQNAQGIRISYEYNLLANNEITIKSIKYGSPTAVGNALNEILFTYKTRHRPEVSYVGGLTFANNTILSQIRVKSNNVGFRNYNLTYNISSLGYERLTAFTEKTGDNSLSYKPLVFSYEDTAQTISYTGNTPNLFINNVNSRDNSTITGDFNGDGSMDFILKGQSWETNFKLFNSIATAGQFNAITSPTMGYFSTVFASSFLTGDVSSGYKLIPKQCWTVVSGNGSNYKTYSLDNNNNIILEHEKSVFLSTYSSAYCDQNCELVAYEFTPQRNILNGDFNGDGISDVIAFDYGRRSSSNGFQGYYDEYDSYNCAPISNPNSYEYYNAVHFIDLDKRVSATNQTYVGQLNGNHTGYYVSQVLDYNGDGKSDFMIIEHGKVSVYSFSNIEYALSNTNTLELLFSTSNANISPLRPILIGDYNGDGKSDFITPNGIGNTYTKFISNGFNFTITAETYTMPYYQPEPNLSWQYIPNDMDGDGKTDLIMVKYGEDVANNNGGYISMRIFENANNTFSSNMFAQTGLQANIQKNPAAIFLTPNFLNKKLEMAFISGSKIHYFQSSKDFNKDRLLRKITNGNGVQDIISYKPLIEEPYNNNSIYKPTTLTEFYPRTDIANAPTLQVVSKLEKQIAAVYKKQLFSYYGAVSDVSGVGFLGFRATMKTNWFDDSHQIISSVSKSDINLRGANIENHTILGLQNPWDASPVNNFITKNSTVYNQYAGQPFENPLQANKVFKLKQTQSSQLNGLDNTSAESVTLYDAYNNAEEATTTVKNSNVVEQVTHTKIGFENTPTGASYIIGRPKTKTQTVTVYTSGDVSTSEELFDYQNNLLTKIQRRGTNSGQTTPYLTEDNIYDAVGNITQKTITAAGLAPRITYYEYNPVAPFYGRFLTKSTDIEGLETQFVYDGNNGTLKDEINPFGLSTKHFYDKWFKKTQITDYLGKSKYYKYERFGNETTITTTADDGSASFEVFDDLGRKHTVGAKNIDGNISQTSFLYDLYDRNYKTSEPYFDGPEQWSETQYDVYSRPIQSVNHTGKVINMFYNGLVTTVDDGLKTKSSLKNALEQVVSMTDTPGGTVVYKFFANGNLQQTIFGGATTTITQDGYGRKKTLNDPSAGILGYEYNAFGETLKEMKFDAAGPNATNTNPTGITEYAISDVGKTAGKTVKGFNGDPTNTTTTYVFDATTKLITSSTFIDIANGKGSNYSYFYDGYKRLETKVEDADNINFIQGYFYDAFGRIEIEVKYASEYQSSTSSYQSVSYVYKNGFQYQIINNNTGQLLHQIDNVNARDQVTQSTLGDSMIQNNSFDAFGYNSHIDYTNTINGNTLLSLGTQFDQQRGNLLYRSNSIFGITENFEYDNLDRLTKFPDAAGNTTFQNYDDKGKITANSIGTYAYTIANKPYQVSTVTPPYVGAPSETYYDQREQNVLYNFFKSPISISVANKETIYFEYNDFNQRSAMYYGGTDPNKANKPLQKFYSADGTMEITYNTSTQTTEFVTYIGGDGYTAPIVVKSDGYTEKTLYLLRDYQGTILGIADDQGQVLEARFFDAWGQLTRLQQNGVAVALPLGTFGTGMLLYSGYTGHEHLFGVELINMNGRIYDAHFHRFLQPDNYVQDPSNTQNYNRYAYCYNNPFKYTDPSGEIIWFVVIAAVVGGGANWYAHGAKFDMEGLKALELVLPQEL